MENIVIELIAEQTQRKFKRKRCLLQRIGQLTIVTVTIAEFVFWLTEYLLTKALESMRRPKKN